MNLHLHSHADILWKGYKSMCNSHLGRLWYTRTRERALAIQSANFIWLSVVSWEFTKSNEDTLFYSSSALCAGAGVSGQTSGT